VNHDKNKKMKLKDVVMNGVGLGFLCVLLGFSSLAQATWLEPGRADISRSPQREGESRSPHFERFTQLKTHSNSPPEPAIQAKFPAATGEGAVLSTCQLEVFKNGTISAKIAAIAELSDGCIGDNFWTDSALTRSLYTTEFAIALAEQITRAAPEYQAQEHSGMQQWLQVLRASFYLADGNAAYSLDPASSVIRQAVVHALKAVSLSPGWFSSTPYHLANVMYEWLYLVFNLQLQAELFGELTGLLDGIDERFPMHRGWLKNVWIIFDVFSRPNSASNLEQLIAADEKFLLRVRRWAFDRKALAVVDYLPHGPLHWLANYGLGYTAITNEAQALAREALSQFPTKTSWFMTLVSGYQFQLQCEAIAAQYCQAQYRSELLAEFYPHTYRFDEGRFVVHTALDESVVQGLFNASQQVKAQFFRKTQNNQPVADDSTEFLTIYVAHSIRDYADYQYFLFGLPSDNGGIYIEQDATFYTYQRTTADSIYSLEELFRHEYVHYLEARYQIHGQFGENPFHDSPYRQWEVEGLGEYLSGATQYEGVLKRTSLLDGFSNNPSSWMTVPQIVTAKDGFAVYPYGMMLHSYLNDRHPAQYQKMFSLIRNNDIAGYNALIESWLASTSLVAGFSSYMAESLADRDSAREPVTGWLPAEKRLVKSLSLVQQAYRELSKRDYVCQLTDNVPDTTYRCEIHNLAFANPESLNLEMDTTLRRLVEQHNRVEFSDVCYGKNIEIIAVGISASIVCEGELATEFVENMAPFVDAEANFTLFDGQQGSLTVAVFDPELADISTHWQQTAGPAVEIISAADAAVLEFISPLVESDSVLRFAVSVSDGQHTISDEVKVALINVDYHGARIADFTEFTFYYNDTVELELPVYNPANTQYQVSWQLHSSEDNELLKNEYLSVSGHRLLVAAEIWQALAAESIERSSVVFDLGVSVSDGISSSTGLVRLYLNKHSKSDSGTTIEGVDRLVEFEFTSNDTISVSLNAASTLGDVIEYAWEQTYLDSEDAVNLNLGRLNGQSQVFDISAIEPHQYGANGRIILEFNVQMTDSQSLKTVLVRIYINKVNSSGGNTSGGGAGQPTGNNDKPVSGSSGGSIHPLALLLLCLFRIKSRHRKAEVGYFRG
jgi:hypothetical protein